MKFALALSQKIEMALIQKIAPTRRFMNSQMCSKSLLFRILIQSDGLPWIETAYRNGLLSL